MTTSDIEYLIKEFNCNELVFRTIQDFGETLERLSNE